MNPNPNPNPNPNLNLNRNRNPNRNRKRDPNPKPKPRPKPNPKQVACEGTTPGAASSAVAAASSHVTSQVCRPTGAVSGSAVRGTSGEPEAGARVPPALAQHLVEGLAAAAGAAEAAVVEQP